MTYQKEEGDMLYGKAHQFIIPYGSIQAFEKDGNAADTYEAHNTRLNELLGAGVAPYQYKFVDIQLSDQFWVRYPQFSGMENQDVQSTINTFIHDRIHDWMPFMEIPEPEEYPEYIEWYADANVEFYDEKFVSTSFQYCSVFGESGKAEIKLETANYLVDTGEFVELEDFYDMSNPYCRNQLKKLRYVTDIKYQDWDEYRDYIYRLWSPEQAYFTEQMLYVALFDKGVVVQIPYEDVAFCKLIA